MPRRPPTSTLFPYTTLFRSQQEAGLATVPLAAFKQGNFSSVSTPIGNPFNNNQPFPGNQIPQELLGKPLWSKQGAGLLALFPDPNGTGTANNFVSAGTGKFNINQFSARLDHKLSEKDSLFGVYEFADSAEFFPITNQLCSARDVPGFR